MQKDDLVWNAKDGKYFKKMICKYMKQFSSRFFTGFYSAIISPAIPMIIQVSSHILKDF